MPSRYPAKTRKQVVELARSGTKVTQLAQTFGMSEAQIDEAVRLYRNGWTLHYVGQHLGVADQTIRRVLVEHVVTIRPGGRRKALAVT